MQGFREASGTYFTSACLRARVLLSASPAKVEQLAVKFSGTKDSESRSKMLFRLSGSSTSSRSIATTAANIANTFIVRHFSRKRAENVRKINPKVPREQAYSIAQSLYGIIKQHGPLTVANTWNHAKDAGIDGLNSKTHMKLMLKWMRGRNLLKLLCNHVGNSKKFLFTTLPEEHKAEQSEKSSVLKLKTEKPAIKKKRAMK